jgi:hypothetical protein
VLLYPKLCRRANRTAVSNRRRGWLRGKRTEELTEDIMYCIQHCFICRPSDSTVSEYAGIELLPWQSEALTTRLDLLHRTEELLSKRMMKGVLACLCIYMYWQPILL